MRKFNYDIMNVIKKRWSPRSFSESQVDVEDVKAIIEAAKYAPSCFNEQPWKFIIATEKEDLTVLRSFMNERNLKWAGKAPVLILILTHNVYNHNNKSNAYAQFDAGTAWGFLSLEAVNRGYQTHAMAGYDHELAKETLSIPDDYDLIALVALGKPGNLEDLDDMFKKGEKPNTRKPLDEMYCNINTFKEV